MPHGGGKKIPTDGPDYRTLLNWVSAGAPRTPADALKTAEVGYDHLRSLRY